MSFMSKDSLITIFGATGLLGSAVLRVLKLKGYENINTPSSKEVNLIDKLAVDDYFSKNKPEFVFMVAGLVGGIMANKKRQADFLYVNSMMILNVLNAIKDFSPKTKVLFTGSTCIYPKENPQPINEDRFMKGSLEESNKGYAVAKGLGIVAAQLYREQYNLDIICAMPTNLYGPNDNYDLENGHFLAALIKKVKDAKENNTELTFWGSGNPRREALYSDDCADALIYLMNNYSDSQIINVGTGFDASIKEYVKIATDVFDYHPQINWDETKPDGTFEKRTDISRLKQIYKDYNPRPFKEGLSLLISKMG